MFLPLLFLLLISSSFVAALVPPKASTLRIFTTSEYEEMRDDTARSGAYERALGQLVDGRTTVLDVGTGRFALWALEAARLGARSVFGVEVNDEAADAARRAVQKAAARSVTVIIEGLASEVELPSRVDLVVHELLGEIAGRESAVQIVEDAMMRHGHSGTRSLPAKAFSWVAPAELRFIDERGLPILMPPQRVPTMRFESFDFKNLALSSPQIFESIDFDNSNELLQQTALIFDVEQEGDLGGFAIFITAQMIANSTAPPKLTRAHFHASSSEEFGFSSAWEGSSWSNPFLRLNLVSDEIVRVHPGDRIRLSVQSDLRRSPPCYHFKAHLEAGTAEPLPLADAKFE